MTEDDDLADLAAAFADDLTLLLGSAERTLRGELFRLLAARGHDDIRPAHLPVFAGLKGGGSRISELAARAGLTRQAMSMLVRDVEAAGYVASEADPDDGRAVRIRLTTRGAAFCRDAAACSREIGDSLSASLGAEQVDTLRTLSRAIATPGR